MIMKSEILEYNHLNNKIMRKRMTYLSILMIALIGIILVSCKPYSNYGTSSDRTGTNGATNGNGKVPRDNTHNYRY